MKQNNPQLITTEEVETLGHVLITLTVPKSVSLKPWGMKC